MSKGAPSGAQSEASRRNGRKGGAPRGKRSPVAKVLAELRANKMIEDLSEEMVEIVRDIARGLIGEGSATDMRLAASDLLDRNARTARATKHESIGEGSGPRGVVQVDADKIVVKTRHKAPEGWTPDAPDAPADHDAEH